MASLVARIAGVLLVVAVAAAVGCGGGRDGPQARDDVAEVRAAIEAYGNALHEGDWQQVHTFFDKECRKQCSLEEFIAGVGPWAEFLTGLTMEVTHISVEGDTATAELMVTPTGSEGTPNTWQLVREDGQWRLWSDPRECCHEFRSE